MQVLSYGYSLPETNDRGLVWFAAVAASITRVNAHDHDGVDSAKLTINSFTATTSTLAAASWVATAGGTYSQTVTVPAGVSLNQCALKFKHSDGSILELSFTQNSATSFTAFINDNSVTVTAIYGL